MIRRLPLALVVFLVLLASCVDRTFSVTVGGELAATAMSSETTRTACSASHGDWFPRENEIPMTVVPAKTPITIEVAAGAGTSEIRGWLYDVEAPAPGGGPLEEFSIQGPRGTHRSSAMQSGRTYQVLVNVTSSFLVFGGEVTRILRVRIEPE